MSDGFESIWYSESEVQKLQNELAVANVMADHYREAYSDSARALLNAEDVGWTKLGVSNSDITQITLTEAKEVSRRLHGYAETNPLLTRGREVRCSYLFSSRYEVNTKDAKTEISTQQKNTINSRRNQDAVFSMEALERIEGERYSAGQVFVLYDRTKKEFQHLSFQQIGDIIYSPDDPSEIRYVMRAWTANVILKDGTVKLTDFKEYYPAHDYDRPAEGYVDSINDVPVNTDKRMLVDRVNIQAGGNLGIPDSFAAAPWALAYSAYLSDGSKVLAALAEWAWLVKPKKRPAAETAAAAIRTTRGAGGSLVTDADVTAMPTKDAIDLNTGRPLAAQVASALGISIVLLLADPGQSGAYGTAQTLSDPNRRTMEARRERNTKFLLECLKLIGFKDPDIVWPKMSPGTDGEESDVVMKAWGSGLFRQEEVRPRLAELAHISLTDENPPEGFMYPNNVQSLNRADIDNDAAGGNVKTDGSTAMTNGQGRDSLKIGNLSHQAKSDSQRGSKSSRANT